MLHDDHVGLGHIDRGSDARIPGGNACNVAGLSLQCQAREIDRRASGYENAFRLLPHFLDTHTGVVARDKMNVGQLGVGMPGLFVNRACHLATLHMDQRNVHVGGGDGGGDGFIAVGDGHNHVRLQVVEDGCQFRKAKARWIWPTSRDFRLQQSYRPSGLS